MDLIPEGCISLRAAYKRFVRELWGADSPLTSFNFAGGNRVLAQRSSARLAKVQTEVLAELVSAFASNSLDAYVRPPNAPENFAIPADSWERAFFPERCFLAIEFVDGHGDYWDGLAGRTPFVRQTQFETWLGEQVARRADPAATPSPANRALMDYLLGLAADGLASSTEVESLAGEWGLPRFASDPPAESFDALKLPQWTLCMAVSWIVWRTLEDVRQAVDDYRAQCWRWTAFRHAVHLGSESCQVEGEELITLQPLKLTLLGIAEATNTDPREKTKTMSVKSAREELWRALSQGKLSATALDHKEGVVEIPAREWERLKLAGRKNGDDCLVFRHAPLCEAYSDMSVPSSILRQLWPSMDELTREIKVIKRDRAPPPAKRKVEATKQALSELYPDGVPVGLSVKARLIAVNNWHQKKGNSPVSLSTVLRALDS